MAPRTRESLPVSGATSPGGESGDHPCIAESARLRTASAQWIAARRLAASARSWLHGGSRHQHGGVAAGLLHPDAASDQAQRLFTVVLSGVISQQMANQPGASYDAGMFTSLTDAALDMFFARYTPSGGPDADPRP